MDLFLIPYPWHNGRWKHKRPVNEYLCWLNCYSWRYSWVKPMIFCTHITLHGDFLPPCISVNWPYVVIQFGNCIKVIALVTVVHIQCLANCKLKSIWLLYTRTYMSLSQRFYVIGIRSKYYHIFLTVNIIAPLPLVRNNCNAISMCSTQNLIFFIKQDILNIYTFVLT